MEPKLALHARLKEALSTALLAVLLLAPAGAWAQDATARKLFDQGVDLYQKGDYRGAAAAFAASQARAPDDETLFAWAQAERMAGECKRALELFSTLLASDLPEANKAAVRENMDRCQEQLAPAPEPERPPPAPTATTTPPGPAPPLRARPAATATRAADRPAGRAWYADPVGGALVGGGAVGIGVGIGFLLSARSADRAKDGATDYFAFAENRDRAETRGKIGTASLAAGALLVGAGVAWYALARPRDSGPALSLWMDPGAGGVVLAGGF